MARRKSDKPTDSAGPKDTTFMATAMNQWRTADTAEGGGAGSMRAEGLLDQKFLNLQQWDENQERDRLAQDKPTLVIDQIGEPYRQLVGQLRRAKPSIQINPVDNGADQDTAEVYQGVYRHIEQTGHAKAARDEAAKGMAGIGWGYYRVITDFEYDQTDPNRPLGPELFDQCIKYQPIENQFSVFRDPACPIYEPWKARFAFVVEDVPVDTFKQKWPHAKATSQEAFQASGLAMPEWYPEGSVRVADYFYVEETPGQEVALLTDGRVVPLLSAPVGQPILQRRKLTVRTVKLAKITGTEILEGNDDLTGGRPFPADYIPIIPMYGESLMVDGKRTLRGIVRPARDPQRMYNYQNSELVYELALAPKSKVIMAEGQDEGYEQMWQQAPVKAFPALKYKPTSLNGERVPEPKVAQFTDPAKVQALTMAIAQHKADLRSTTGWYDATDPNRKNTDQSGRAILARKEAQSEGAVNYTENYQLALHYEAMVVLSMIPRIYNRAGRVLRIVGDDDAQQDGMRVYGQQPSPEQSRTMKGIKGMLSWGSGRYDITVSIGANPGTRRQEAAEWQLDLMKVLPPEMAAAMAPVAVRNMDGPGHQEIADRLDRTLPPGIRGDGDKETDPAQLQAANAQLQQQAQEMGQVIKGLQDAIKTDVAKEDAKARAQMDVKDAEIAWEREKLEKELAAKVEIARITAGKAAFDARLAALEERIALGAQFGHESREAERDRQHERDMAAMGHDHALEQADAGVAGQMALQDAAPEAEA